MGATVLWALLTGAITGGAWVAIVLLQRQNRLQRDYQDFRLEEQRGGRELQQVHQRLAEVEERLDFAERLLTQQSGRSALPPDRGTAPS